MKTVGAYEAKTFLPKLLKQVAQGGCFLITKNGMPLALMSPAPQYEQKDAKKAIQELKELRRGKTLNGLKVRTMIAEGRKF